MKKARNEFVAAGVLLLVFLLFTVAVQTMDIQPIGPEGSPVGFASFNGYVHQVLGVHPGGYRVTEVLGVVPLLTALGFAVLGFYQWIRRRDIRAVDTDLVALGVLYALLLAAYVLFEVVIINYRPVLLDGVLEASYPSSHTMLALCILTTAMMQFRVRIHNRWGRRAACVASMAVMVVLVMGRLISGVHWITDILGGLLLSASLILLYAALSSLMQRRIVRN